MRRLGEALLLIVVSLVLFFGIAELTLRAYLSRHTFYDVEMSRYARSLKLEARDPRVGHVHGPNGEAHLMGVDVRINSDGLRDEEHPIEHGERRRYVFLGDSLTFGWGVEQPQSFARLLAPELDAEILNFGIGNYNTNQEVGLFLEKGLKYQPDEVVVFYFINDAEPVPQKSRFPWLGSSRLVTFYWSRVKALAARWSAAPNFQEYYAALYQDGAPGWEQAKAAFLELRDVCRERGIGLRVVLLPELHQLRDYPFAREYAMVAEFLRTHGIPVLDLTPRLADVENPQSLWVARDDAHPNAAAHALIARHSADFLRGEAAR